MTHHRHATDGFPATEQGDRLRMAPPTKLRSTTAPDQGSKDLATEHHCLIVV